MRRLEKLAGHLMPRLAYRVLFTPLHTLLQQKDAVYEASISREDVGRFSWCTWPDRSWYFKVKSTIVRALAIRMFFLQYFVAMGPRNIRYWSYIVMDQHIPLILWCEKHRRAPSYMECVRNGLLPADVTPVCEETLCVSEYGLQDILQHHDNSRDFFKIIVKSLPRRCICRDVEECALKQMSPGSNVARIFKWMRLGNSHAAAWRPCLRDRIAIHAEDHEEALALASKTERSLSHALSLYVAVTIKNCHAYCSVMRGLMQFDDFWKNTHQLCDRVFRPALCDAMRGKHMDTAKSERVWNKKKRPAPHREKSVTARETFLKLLITASNTNKKPVRPTLVTAAMAVNYPDSILEAVTAFPECANVSTDALREIISGGVPRKNMVSYIKEHLTPEEIHTMATLLSAYVRPNQTLLLPLPVHFYKAQAHVHKTYRICPLCSSFDFNVVGWKRKTCQFESCPRRNWILVCTACDPVGIPTLSLQMRGRILVLAKHTLLLCCKCNQIADSSSGAYARGGYPFLCQRCYQRKRG